MMIDQPASKPDLHATTNAPMNPFDPASIHDAVSGALARSPIPAGQHGQFVVLVNRDTFETSVASKIGESWTVGASGGVSRSAGWVAQAEAVHTW